MLCAIGLAGCGAFDATKESAAGRGPVVEALLQPAGGGPWQGSAKFTDRGDGVLVTLFFTNQIPGTYRLAVHANGNCSSPNFFSAGPPWVPAGSGKTPAEMTPEIHTNSDGDVAATFQMHGVKISGENSLQGRSIIIHWGREINGTESGAANKRVLCGVIGPVRSFLS
jgi:Cu-Zn family superoxide dismutase